MSTTVDEYPSVTELATFLGCIPPTGMAILPVNFDSAKAQEELLHRSEAATVRSLFRQNELSLDDIFPTSAQPGYIQNNGYEWIGPTIFISHLLFGNQPVVATIAINILSNYLTDFFKGVPGSKRVKLAIVLETTEDGTCKRISFDGPPEALQDIQEIIQEISREK